MIAYDVSAFLVVRPIVELVTIDYSDPASYDKDFGGSSLAGVLAVHCLPGVVALVLMLGGARPLRPAVSTDTVRRFDAPHPIPPRWAPFSLRRVFGEEAQQQPTELFGLLEGARCLLLAMTILLACGK